jgi:hypothetical protein
MHPGKLLRIGQDGLAALGLAAMALAAAPAPSASAQERIEARRPFNANGSIRIYNLVGTIRVVGWNRDSVAVTGLEGKGAKFFIAGFRHAIKMGVDVNPELKEAQPSDVEVHVPVGARVWIKGGSTDVEVSGVTGGIDVSVVGGRIRVTGSPRELNADCMDGDIEITGSPEWLRAKTAGGSITLRGSGQDVGLSTVSGRILAVGERFSRARFESVTGDIRFDGDVEPLGGLDFDTHSGTVELHLPASVAANFDVTSIAGTIDNAITAARPIAGREMRGQELHFSTNPSAANVSIRSFKGAVVLRRKK